eukprot:3936617-Rhodomonas_salina.3
MSASQPPRPQTASLFHLDNHGIASERWVKATSKRFRGLRAMSWPRSTCCVVLSLNLRVRALQPRVPANGSEHVHMSIMEKARTGRPQSKQNEAL